MFNLFKLPKGDMLEKTTYAESRLWAFMRNMIESNIDTDYGLD